MGIGKQIRRRCGCPGLVMVMMGWLLFPASAETIELKDYVISGSALGVPTDRGGKVQVPVETTRPVEKSQPGNPLSGKTEAQLLEKIDELQKRIERLERIIDESRKAGVSPLPGSGLERKPGEEAAGVRGPAPPRDTAIHEQLLREEMGQVRGVIQWQGKPMAEGSVRIELERYTGFSLTSVKKKFAGEAGGSVDQGLSLSTRTDAQGRYAFPKVPPGSYRLYWMPDFKTGWIHRLRENPDFEVFSGKVTVQNIPDKPSILRVKEKK